MWLIYNIPIHLNQCFYWVLDGFVAKCWIAWWRVSRDRARSVYIRVTMVTFTKQLTYLSFNNEGIWVRHMHTSMWGVMGLTLFFDMFLQASANRWRLESDTLRSTRESGFDSVTMETPSPGSAEEALKDSDTFKQNQIMFLFLILYRDTLGHMYLVFQLTLHFQF